MPGHGDLRCAGVEALRVHGCLTPRLDPSFADAADLSLPALPRGAVRMRPGIALGLRLLRPRRRRCGTLLRAVGRRRGSDRRMIQRAVPMAADRSAIAARAPAMA